MKRFIKALFWILSISILTLIAGLTVLFFVVSAPEKEQKPDPKIVNDVTQINPIEVAIVKQPHTIEEVAELVKNHIGPISIGGGRYSMGGQTATEQALQLDMREFNKVLNFSKEKKEITVQTGITWRMIQEYIDSAGLSLKVMQTYANFSVGGSLSVNVHGRYVGLGPLIYAVKSIKMVIPSGEIITASPIENAEIFYGAIGGYGAMGVIVEATLSLADNVKVERSTQNMALSNYKSFFFSKIRDDSTVVFHNADIYPNEYTAVRSVTYTKTDKSVTIPDRLQPKERSYRKEKFAMWVVSETPFGKWFRQYIIDPLFFGEGQVVWRNYEASYDVHELEPSSRKNSTYVLQEYFVPVEKLDSFVPKMAEIFNRHKVNVINVSIRHAKKDLGSLLAWAKTEVFAFVVYYKQGTSDEEKQSVGIWTRELINAATFYGGAYYLPYQIHATDEQFKAAYPNADVFFALKKKLDPTNKFRNKLWDAYYKPNQDSVKVDSLKLKSRFKRLLSQTGKSDSLQLFLQNVYGLYSPDKYLYLIKAATNKFGSDKEIYEAIQKELPTIKPTLWAFQYAIPALKKQKKEIAAQTASLLGGKSKINGYLEIGSTGRYVNALKNELEMYGPVYISYYEKPNYGPQDIIERGQIFKTGTFFDLNSYDPIPKDQVADTSLDLVTMYIGLHHCPSAKLDEYVQSIRRVLRTGGKLVIRDHNVTSPGFNDFVSLIHDVFYCGLDETWQYTSSEIRNFTSSDSLSNYLSQRGFSGGKKRLLQANDPSLNTLMVFTKTKEQTPNEKLETELNQIKGWKRDEAQTYLTLPEWYLVFNPDEYARFIATKRPSLFPYFKSIKQFWQYYADVYDITKEKYAFNSGYHLMIGVIGTSFTLENLVKGLHEKTIGRVSEWIRGDQLTQEDVYAAKVAKHYWEFIRVDPWYEFPYTNALVSLWRETDFVGKNLLRKWERKMILTNEYAVKSVYAYLIKMGTKQVYGDADAEMLVKTNKFDMDHLKGSKKVKITKVLSDSSIVLSLPRYEDFQQATLDLFSKGVVYNQVAGNENILLTSVVPSKWNYNLSQGKVLIQHQILTDHSKKRIGINAPVSHLHEITQYLASNNIRVEHIYDF